MNGKTLHIAMPFLGQKVGGSHMSGLLLAKGLQDHCDCRVTVIGPKGSEVLDLARDFGVAAEAGPDKPNGRNYDPLFVIAGLADRRSALKKFAPDIVHSNDLNALQAWGPAAKLLSVPVIHHDRGLGRRFPKLLAIRLSDHVISISEATFNRLNGIALNRKSRIIDPFLAEAVEPGLRAKARADILAELSAPADAPVFGFVGNLWNRKRPLYFLDAAASLAGEIPDARFVIYGRNGDFTIEQIRQAAEERGIGDKVLMAGFRVPAETNLATLDVLAVPAVREPLGRTPIEAIVQDVPYVATEEAGHAEIFKRWKGGLAISPDASPQAFAELLVRALREREALILNAEDKARMLDELSLERHAQSVLRIYQSALRR